MTGLTLRSVAGLPALLVAQALGAFNDNVLKTIISLVLVGRAIGAEDGSAYLSLSGVAFVLPYLLFSGFAGYVTDRFSKRTVLVAAKFAELVIIFLSVLALLLDRVDLLIAVLFLMATQSTFFSPAKYGILPEMLPTSKLSRANGLIESTRYLAIILGTITGGLLLATSQNTLSLISIVLIGAATTGVVASLSITNISVSHAAVPFRFNPWHEIRVGLGRIRRVRPLRFAVAGITCLEFTGCLVLLDIILMAKTVLGLDELGVGLLGGSVGLGAALGSFVCGRLSGSRVCPEFTFLGLIGVASILFALTTSSNVYVVGVMVFMLGAFGGASVVPLYALLQKKSGVEQKGQIIASNNFLNMAGVLLASAALWLLNDLLGLGPERVLFWCGAGLVIAIIVALRLWPEYGFRGSRPALGPIDLRRNLWCSLPARSNGR